MERRKFLVSSLVASALAVTTPGSYAEAAQGAMQGKGREFYQLRRYHLNSGPKENFAMIFSAMRSYLRWAAYKSRLSACSIFRLGRRRPRFMC